MRHYSRFPGLFIMSNLKGNEMKVNLKIVTAGKFNEDQERIIKRVS